MKQKTCLSILFAVGLLAGGLSAQDTPDLAGPVVTWNAPGENSCWPIDAAHPELGLVVSAEDPSGVKQGTMWMKAGHYGLADDFREWSRVWGHTYAHDGSAPSSVRETILVPMMGRSEGEYTFVVEFADMARHNTRLKLLHVSVDFAAPVVTIATPTDGRVVCRDRTLYVRPSASDSGCGVAQLQLYLNEVTSTTPLAVDTSAPYELPVRQAHLAVNSLRIIVVAIDRAGRSSRAEVTVRPTMICTMRATR